MTLPESWPLVGVNIYWKQFFFMFEVQLLILAVLLIGAVVVLYRRLSSLQGQLSQLRFDKQSQSVKYGRLSEQFMPFLKDYPYDPQDFRFLGTPVDGVQFTDKEVVFMEFKSAGGKLSEKQKQVKGLVESGKVRFEERRVG